MTVSASEMLKSNMRYGLYLGLVLALCSFVLCVGVDLNNLGLFSITFISILLGFVPTVIGIVYFMKRFRDKENGGFLTYKEGLRFGTQLMLFAGIITAAYSVVQETMISPGYEIKKQEIVMEKTIDYYQRIGLSDSDIEKQIGFIESAIEESKKTSPISIALWSIPQSALYGFIISLIVALIFKRKEDSFTQAMKEIEE